jgi:hypothetical protein
MKKYLLITALLAVTLIACNNENDKKQDNNSKSKIDGSYFNGSWAYRSLLNDTNWQTDFDSLEFASAIMDLKTFGKDSISGILYWATDPKQGLAITGRFYYNDTVTCYSLIGIGDSSLGTPEWQYDYQGYIVPKWSFGVNQANVLVGSVARAKPHGSGAAGLVAITCMGRRKN